MAGQNARGRFEASARPRIDAAGLCERAASALAASAEARRHTGKFRAASRSGSGGRRPVNPAGRA